jgi:hypothetical protein
MPWLLLLALLAGWCTEYRRPAPEIAVGVVFHDKNRDRLRNLGEPGLANIRVSNGREITLTNAKGAWRLPAPEQGEFFVIKPRGWMTPVKKQGTPLYYYVHRPQGSPESNYAGSTPTGQLPTSIDFGLVKQKESDDLRVLMYGDPQPRNHQEIQWMKKDVVEECKGFDGSFGMALGDITFNDLSLFEEVASTLHEVGIPWWMVVGNHDINFDAPEDRLSNETFIAAFGPPNYSFDWGPAHFLVLDDVQWILPQTGKGHYKAQFSDDALAFSKNDLALVPKDKLVVVAMHIPLRDVSNNQQLLNQLQEFQHSVSVSGHTHTQRVDELGVQHGWKKKEPHTHVVHVTACGSWWSGEIDENRGVPHSTLRDGTPKGWLEWTFTGNQWKFDFRAAGADADQQMHVTLGELREPKKGTNEKANLPVWVNVWNGDPQNKVEARLAGTKTWHTLKRKVEKDPAYLKLFETESTRRAYGRSWRKLPEAINSTHLWFGNLSIPRLWEGSLAVEARVLDRWGRTHQGFGSP